MTDTTGTGEAIVVTLPAGADHARPMAPLGAMLSRRLVKLDRLRREIERVRAAPVGDWQERIAEMERAVCWVETTS